MLMIILGILVFAVIIGVGIFVLKGNSSISSIKEDVLKKPTYQTSLDYVKIQEFYPNCVDLGKYRFRAVIECSSLNRGLKTGEENQIIDIQFQRFLNSLSFPCTIFVQTREIDNTPIIEQLEEDIVEAKRMFPAISSYADRYFMEMQNLPDIIGVRKHKKKYVIVSYDDARNLDKLRDDEKKAFAVDELRKRAQTLISGLEAIGLSAHVLNKMELYELAYSTFHREEYRIADDISIGKFQALAVNSEKPASDPLNADQTLDLYLYEFISRLENPDNFGTSSKEECERRNLVIQNLHALAGKEPKKYENGKMAIGEDMPDDWTPQEVNNELLLRQQNWQLRQMGREEK